MVNSIKLINNNITGPNGLKLLHGALTYAWKNIVTTEPGEGFFGIVESQFSGWENPTLNLIFHIPIGTAYADGTEWMNWEKWNQLVKNQYIGTEDSATSLQFTVGDDDTPFIDYSNNVGTSSPKIQIRGYTLTLSPDESRNSYFWTINARVQITK